MAGSFNEILPDPISAEDEQILVDMLKQKLKSAVKLSVHLLQAAEARFGPEARELIQDVINNRQPAPREDTGDPASDLHEFCDTLDKGCAGSHRWERVLEEPDRIGYHFTRCMWAELFRELGEPELGFIFCAGDEPAVKSHNPRLGFTRTKVLMHDDDFCDHVFYVEK
jgi:hypothetical protein